MLQNSFCHIKGITVDAEKELWENGILSWDDFESSQALPLTPARVKKIRAALPESRKRLADGDVRFFADGFPNNRLWRAFPHFRDKTVYLDIETTGLTRDADHITTIAMYDGKKVFHYVYGQNLDSFVEDIKKYDLIITYNGKSFDIPFINNYFGIKLDQAHIDLRYPLKNLGFSGGLKNIEKRMGIDRGDIDGVDGMFATYLWKDYKYFQNDKALETLLAYNIEDVLNLETLMINTYNLMLRVRPVFMENSLTHSTFPEIPFKPHLPTIEKLKSRYPAQAYY